MLNGGGCLWGAPNVKKEVGGWGTTKLKRSLLLILLFHWNLNGNYLSDESEISFFYPLFIFIIYHFTLHPVVISNNNTVITDESTRPSRGFIHIFRKIGMRRFGPLDLSCIHLGFGLREAGRWRGWGRPQPGIGCQFAAVDKEPEGQPRIRAGAHSGDPSFPVQVRGSIRLLPGGWGGGHAGWHAP